MATKNMAVVVCANCKHRNYVHPAKLMRAIHSDKRAQQARLNGSKGGRPKGSKTRPKSERKATPKLDPEEKV